MLPLVKDSADNKADPNIYRPISLITFVPKQIEILFIYLFGVLRHF